MATKGRSIIFGEQDRCYICLRYGRTDEHHIFGGRNRKLSDMDGLTVRLCRKCHRALHDKGVMEKELHVIGEKAWLRTYHKSVDDFVERYGKNYLDCAPCTKEEEDE